MQSYRRPNFRSQPILSEFFASQTAMKKCFSSKREHWLQCTTCDRSRWLAHSNALSCDREFVSSGRSFFDPPKSCDKPTSPNFDLLGDQNPNLSLTAFKQGEERDSKSRRKKKHGPVFPPCVQLQVLLNWPSRDDRHCTARRILFQKSTEQYIVAKKEHTICTLLMIEQTLTASAFKHGQPKLTKLSKKDVQ